MKIYYSNTIEDTISIAKEVASQLKAGDILAYTGNLGAGKTTFTSGLARGLGIDINVTSPTFALVNEYRNQNANGLSLFHFDMYRITDHSDVETTGFFDYLDENQILAVEWSENITDVLAYYPNTIYISFETVLDDSINDDINDEINIEQINTKRKITITTKDGGERF